MLSFSFIQLYLHKYYTKVLGCDFIILGRFSARRCHEQTNKDFPLHKNKN